MPDFAYVAPPRRAAKGPTASVQKNRVVRIYHCFGVFWSGCKKIWGMTSVIDFALLHHQLGQLTFAPGDFLFYRPHFAHVSLDGGRQRALLEGDKPIMGL